MRIQCLSWRRSRLARLASASILLPAALMKFISIFRFRCFLLVPAVIFAVVAGYGTAHAKGGHGGRSNGHAGHRQHTGRSRNTGTFHHGITGGSRCLANSFYYNSHTGSDYCCNSSSLYYPCERGSSTRLPSETETERKMFEHSE
jgi:hypothetical protein